MKYEIKIFLMCILIFLSSCKMPIIPNGYHSIEDIAMYIKSEIEYKKDSFEFWQYPTETLNKGTGDCEDIAALFAFLIQENRISDDIYLVACWDKLESGFHMILEVDGVFYETTRFYEYVTPIRDDYSILYKINLHNYMIIANFMHILG